MGLETAEAPKSNGLKTALDIIVAPAEAFEQLRVAPTWLFACLIAAVFLIVGYIMQRPAQLHAAVGTIQHMMATNSLFSSMSDEQKQKAVENASHPGPFSIALGFIGVIFSLFIATAINTVVMFVANAAARGNASFSKLWAGSMNIAIPTLGVNYLVLGAICIVLGADHFQNSGDLLRSVPGLATLLPSVHGLLGGFLLGINIFTLWGFALNVAMLRTLAGIRGAAAWIAPSIVLIGGALILGGSSGFYGG